MPRYLTPTKICLLVLVELYASDEIPATARLDVLSFIASHINPPSEYDQFSLEDRAQVSSNDITSFSSILSQWPSKIPGRSLYDRFLNDAWTLHDLDALHVFFERVNNVVAPEHPERPEVAAKSISRASPLGQFIRRCCVEFTRLQFSDSQALCAALATYRAPSYQKWATRNPDAARNLQDQPSWATAPSQGELSQDQQTESLLHTSADDTGTLLSLSIHQLQKLGTRVSPSLKRQLSTWISDIYDSSAQSLQHFLHFFECWRAGQYEGALENLHRYFDYSLVGRGADGAGARGAEGAVGGGMETYYQYALLHLSVLHADFERWGECVDALGECIGTARENNDPTCLNFALSYLLYLRQAHPNTENAATSLSTLSRLIGGGTNDQDEIAFLKTKARDGRNWALLSQTLLEEGRGEMGGVSLPSLVRGF
ncbi:APC5 protein [Saxophila tyrrhenica]|uniref:Anaphase-promoting complex subunit 5 n=1 Tax=Saxophila tyrrhenica TaxID=1690608 RepID=A0AAV9NXX6_9PEZI|nr:APC5 protein [Saxophila tyrrhenica]